MGAVLEHRRGDIVELLAASFEEVTGTSIVWMEILPPGSLSFEATQRIVIRVN